jgi:hypothetical protein
MNADWEQLDVFNVAATAEVVAGLLRSESIPVRIDAREPVPGLAESYSVLVPVSMSKEARNILAHAAISDAELSRLAADAAPEINSVQMILVAGPYRSGTNDDPALIAKNVAAMTDASLRLFRSGHLPVMGEWFALPLIDHAGSSGIGDAIFNEIFHPISRRLVAKCDACLRIGGASAGADEMVALAKQYGKAVYFSIDDIPSAFDETQKRG